MTAPSHAGWYPDPSEPFETHRWWDGVQWTDYTLPQPPPPGNLVSRPGFVTAATGTASPEPHFDASVPPAPGAEVPVDCVWAQIPYPGPLPKRPIFGDASSRMVAIGIVAGRTEAEIVSFVGPAESRSSIGDGSYILQWMSVSAYSSFHYVLSFDRYGVCSGIEHESV